MRRVLFLLALALAFCVPMAVAYRPAKAGTRTVLYTITPAALGQAAPMTVNLAHVTIGWTDPAENADGSPCTDCKEIEIAYGPADRDISGGEAPERTARVAAGVESFRLADMLPPDMPQGPVKIWARALDTSGNASDWSDSLELTHDGIAPAKITIKITIEIQTE